MSPAAAFPIFSSAARSNAFASLLCVLLAPSEGGLAPNKAGLELLVRGLGVVDLSTETLEDRVLSNAGAEEGASRGASSWVVLFCKAGDANCAQLAPSFEQLCLRTVEPSGHVRFGTFDCSLGASSEALCAKLGVEAYPTIAHYQNGKNVGSWTSKKKVGLFPWLYKELQGANAENAPLAQSASQISTKSAPRKPASTAGLHGESLAAPFHGISHLKYLHEYTLMEDCIFSRMLSGLLMALVLAKSTWILVTGAELWPYDLHALPRSSDASVLY